MADIRFTSQLDDFSWCVFPYENPISHGGAWSNIDTRWNGLRSDLHVIRAANFSWSMWTAGPFSGSEPIEVWGETTGGQLGAAGEGWRLGIFEASSVGGSNQADGYQFGWFTALGSTTIHRRYDNGNATDIGAEDINISVWNSLMLVRRDPSGYFGYYVSSDDGATWTLSAHATDLTYTGSFYIAVCAEDPTDGGVGWSAFGGGGPSAFVPQIYRRIYVTRRRRDLD